MSKTSKPSAKIVHLDRASKSLVGEQARYISETAFEGVIERDAYILNAKIGLGPLIDAAFNVLGKWGWV